MDSFDLFNENFGNDEISKEIAEEAMDLGIEVYKEARRTDTDKKLQSCVKMTTIELAVAKKLVPEQYKNAKFDTEYIQKVIREDMKRSHNMYSVERFSKYAETCNGILSTLRTGELPDRSWIIGAPNGFGKTSFVNECILTMEEKNMRTVPYVPLLTLAEIKIAEEKRLLNPLKYRRVFDRNTMEEYTYAESADNYEKMPIDITGRYSWSEYMDAECLFCYFTDVSSRHIESHILYQILSIRAVKALPTVVMIATSLKPYTNDKVLKEQVWDEILGVEDLRYGYDLLTHVSCYKMRRNAIMNAEEDMM